MTPSKAEIRAAMRAERRDLAPRRQAHAAAAVAAHLVNWISELDAGTAAASVATDGELDPGPTVHLLRAHGWQVAYPRVDDDHMSFHLAASISELIPGRWGLVEPREEAVEVAPASLDLVLAPLVAFDAAGNRLGRGRAYYDRAFAFLGSAARPRRPFLVGLAHDLQQVKQLDPAPHDVALDAVVTPAAIYGSLRTS